MTHDWRWFKFRYIILPQDDKWRVWDCAYGQQLGDFMPLLDAYREAIKLNQTEIEYGKQPA